MKMNKKYYWFLIFFISFSFIDIETFLMDFWVLKKKTLILILKMTNIFAHNVFNSQKWLLYSKINFFYMGRGRGVQIRHCTPFQKKGGAPVPLHPPWLRACLKLRVTLISIAQRLQIDDIIGKTISTKLFPSIL